MKNNNEQTEKPKRDPSLPKNKESKEREGAKPPPKAKVAKPPKEDKELKEDKVQENEGKQHQAVKNRPKVKAAKQSKEDKWTKDNKEGKKSSKPAKRQNKHQTNTRSKSSAEKLFRVLDNTAKALTCEDLLRKWDKPDVTLEEVAQCLGELVEQGRVLQKGDRFYVAGKAPIKPSAEKINRNSPSRIIISGTVDMMASGSAFIVSDETDRDVFVPAHKLNKALDGDRVRVQAERKKSGKRMEGVVIQVLERGNEHFVGIISISKQFAFLIASRPLPVDFFIPLKKLNGAENGDKVLIRVREWHNEKQKNPIAEVVSVLGKPGQNNAEMLSILADNGFPLQFPDEVLMEADELPIDIDPKEIARRRDFRQITTFTIDPHDAKDFDDALSIRRLDNGNWEVGVHIADVSHYAKPGSALDREATRRATSVYMVDRVLPMFPEKLSNHICSLRPNEEKLCFSAVFELDADAVVHSRWFGKTVIYSDRRFSYAEAQEILNTQQGELSAELLKLNELAKKLRARRLREGSIEFGSEEVRFQLDENGKPIGIYVKQVLDSNRLIEDFMLLANRSVAAFVNQQTFNGQQVPTVNRIHDAPDIEKLTDYRTLARTFGYDLNLESPKHISQSLNKLLEEVKGKPEQRILETLAIRTMAKAAYSIRTEVGHYGLAFDDYTHFTSPIRRYPDVLTHRILEQCLNPDPHYDMNAEALERKCEHSSAMERKAMEAERQSNKYKQAEYMSDYIGEEFDGVISGVTHFGFFVELKENKCEGLVALDSLIDDHYIYDDKLHTLIGYQKRKRYQLGYPVRVRVMATSLTTRTIDFEVV